MRHGDLKGSDSHRDYMRSYMKARRQAKRSHTAVVEHCGERLVTVDEFWRVMREFPFKNLADRVAFAVCFCTGMRSANPQHLLLRMLNYPRCDTLTYSVVKNRHSIVDNKVQWRIKSDTKMLPRWLAQLLKSHIDASLCWHNPGIDTVRSCGERPLFERMSTTRLRKMFAEMREFFGWHDLWQEVIYFDDEGRELKKQPYHRFATHGLRAGSAHLVDKLTGGDAESVRRWLGHSNMKDTQKYLRRPQHEIMCKKVQALLESKDAELMSTWTDKKQAELSEWC